MAYNWQTKIQYVKGIGPQKAAEHREFERRPCHNQGQDYQYRETSQPSTNCWGFVGRWNRNL